MPEGLRFIGRRGVTGMSLVEVLVTLVSTSVGLLGIAALQLATLRSNHDAYMQLQAADLAGSILERIRGNPAAFRNGEYDDVAFNSTSAAGARAHADLHAWQMDIDRRLPGGAEVSAGSLRRRDDSSLITVTIRWKPTSSDPSSAIRTLSIHSEI